MRHEGGRNTTGNRLLDALPDDEFEPLAHLLEPTELSLREYVYARGERTLVGIRPQLPARALTDRDVVPR